MKPSHCKTFVVHFSKDGCAFERSSIAFTDVPSAVKYAGEHAKFNGSDSYTVYEMNGIYLKKVKEFSNDLCR